MFSRVVLPLIGLLLLGACAADGGSSGGQGGWCAPPGAFTYPPGLEPRRGHAPSATTHGAPTVKRSTGLFERLR